MNIIVYLFQMILLRILFEYIYKNVICLTYPEIFEFFINYTNYIISWAMYIFFLFYTITINKSKTSGLIIFIMFFLSYIPTNIYFGFSSLKFIYFIIFNSYWLILMLFNDIWSIKKIKVSLNIKLNYKKNAEKILLILSILIVLITYIRVHKTVLFVKNTSTYYLREKFSEAGLGVSYEIIFFWIVAVILPCYALKYYYKNKKLFYLLSFVQIINFFIAGHKSQLLLIPFGIILTYILKRNLLLLVPFSLNTISILGIIEKNIKQSDKIIDYLIRRVFFIPAMLNFEYIVFFQDKKKLLFQEDLVISRVLVKLFGIIKTYSISASELVGLEVFNRKVFANNGTFAYGYADLGVCGVLISAIMLVFILKILDKIVEEKERGIVILIFTLSIISMSLSYVMYSIFIPYFLFKSIDNN